MDIKLQFDTEINVSNISKLHVQIIKLSVLEWIPKKSKNNLIV